MCLKNISEKLVIIRLWRGKQDGGLTVCAHASHVLVVEVSHPCSLRVVAGVCPGSGSVGLVDHGLHDTSPGVDEPGGEGKL